MAKKKLSSFDRAFVAARRSGAKDFSFGGKKYSTKQKGEGGAVTKKAAAFTATPARNAPRPTPRPAEPGMSKADLAEVSAPRTSTPKPNNIPVPTPRPARPLRQAAGTPTPNAPRYSVDPAYRAADVADTRKRMELATTPKKSTSYEIGRVSKSKLPQGKVVDYTVNRGVAGKTGPTKAQRSPPKTAKGTTFRNMLAGMDNPKSKK